ncbi:MAG: YqeG family HAD IIIA-type phosphatase [Clostridia bacterium]|jgi:HAD superfamily phosphatase (TIGR01668 family)|nr:YqeG family HAD IIIA-type phosphatase [Clostridia bacterium]
MSLFYPTVYKNRVTDITLQDLEQLGVRGLLLDVDNTLTTHGSQELSEDVRRWLETMKQAGIALTVVSNSWEWRVAPFATKLGLRHISLSCKPSPFGFLRGIHRLKLPKRECAAVGDQVFTDILGANLCGITCIQLQPIALETGKPFLALRRKWERKIYAKRKERET